MILCLISIIVISCYGAGWFIGFKRGHRQGAEEQSLEVALTLRALETKNPGIYKEFMNLMSFESSSYSDK